MDRREIVYYNSRTKRSPVTKSKKRRSNLPAYILAIAFIGVMSISTFGGKSHQPENNSKVLAEQTVQDTQSTQQIGQSDSPLYQIALPTSGQTAIGTLEEGLIKVTDNEHQAPIASITKIITALVLLEKHPLSLGERGDIITLNEKDLAYFNEYYAKLGTVTAVTVGGTMTYYEGLQAMLLPSSNNMSDTLVDRFFESREVYISYANQYLEKNGLKDTIVADASGFSPESKSTPTDLIKLGQLALKNPVIADIVAQKNATLAVAGDVSNYNQLIREPDVIGIKPGTTDEAGYCLLFAARISDTTNTPHTVIIITMGHTDRPFFLQTLDALLQSARQSLRPV
jgi:D-alanyl-D-alanine carboxypeptidase (penicillin-binding protein 5/6)